CFVWESSTDGGEAMRSHFWSKAVLFSLLVAFGEGSTLDPMDDGSRHSSGEGKLLISVKDTPLLAKEVWVTISDIELHSTTSGWQSLPPETATFDLLKLGSGQQALLEQATLTAGTYTRIRLLVTNSFLIDLQDQRCEVKVPSEKIEIPTQFDIAADTTTRLV